MFYILGPCVIEGELECLEAAETIASICSRVGVDFIFKSSYDKANRTSIKSYRGPGLKEGLRILAKVKEEVGCRVLSDVHEAGDVIPAQQVLDVLQIPAFLCRQTDLLLEAGKSGRTVNVKKGQFLAPWDMQPIIEKLEYAGCKDIWITERGTSFGYNQLMFDPRHIPILKSHGYPVIFDATHCVQKPGGLGWKSGGNREDVPVLVRAAVAAGSDGVFLEVHKDPDHALCDGPNMVRMSELEGILRESDRIAHIPPGW